MFVARRKHQNYYQLLMSAFFFKIWQFSN